MANDAWALDVAPSAQRDLGRLDGDTRSRIAAAIERLADDPDGWRRLKRLSGDDVWRLRVGDYRAIIDIDFESRTLRVLRVRHRREVYR